MHKVIALPTAKKVQISEWYYEVTDQATNAITGITRNRNYEVKLQALNGEKTGPWSAIKTIFVK